MLIAPGFFALLASIAARVAKAVANRRAAQELAEWDARALKDIGLTQADVRGALALPFHEDPTILLASLSGRKAVIHVGDIQVLPTQARVSTMRNALYQAGESPASA